ncbi:hypothetical protein [Streptomyces sp. NPDC059262]|uniref:hypothetical protein n=1 Tax=Streptomyces sp. NPDC059262 TaxID=3346797 RepID=UPI0036818E4F
MELTTAHMRLIAESADVGLRQAWRWLAALAETGSPEKPERRRFRVTEEIIDVLADYQGNAKRALEQLVRVAEEAGEKPVGLTRYPATRIVSGRAELEQTRRVILDAAGAVFADRGYAAARVRSGRVRAVFLMGAR